MEKYSKHLESVVAERTQDLVAEKAKTDRLLHSKTNSYTFLLNLVLTVHTSEYFVIVAAVAKCLIGGC